MNAKYIILELLNIIISCKIYNNRVNKVKNNFKPNGQRKTMRLESLGEIFKF